MKRFDRLSAALRPNDTLKLRVFISSTFVDLQAYRQAVFNAIMGIGDIAEDMVFWSADERSSSTASLNRVQESDVVILLLAHRYGYIPEGSSYSITEQEYRGARSSGIPVLAFLIDDSIPWPPQNIQWDKRAQLTAFKDMVKAEVVVKSFTTPDHLAALVSQALATFRERHRQAYSVLSLPERNTVRVDSSANLRNYPDLTIQIGRAEDELPLLVQIQRSQDLTQHFDEISRIIRRPGLTSPDALLSTFRQSIEEYSLQAWASDGIETVSMCDGSKQELLITSTPLSSLFRSTLAAILSPAPKKGKRIGTEARFTTRSPTALSRNSSGGARPLQSEGGSNRFLGVSIKTGNVFSIGRPRDHYGILADGWVEWRPFIFESIPHNFSDARFVISNSLSRPTEQSVPYDQYQQALLATPLDPDTERIPASVSVTIPRNTIGKLIVEIAKAVAELHKRGLIHGDLKANNVLLSSDDLFSSTTLSFILAR